jgi:hypothetical protein
MLLSHFSAKDDRDLVWLPDGAISSEQFSEPVQRGSTMEDEIVAELDLGEDQPKLTFCLLALPCCEEGCVTGEPLLTSGPVLGRANQRAPGGA